MIESPSRLTGLSLALSEFLLLAGTSSLLLALRRQPSIAHYVSSETLVLLSAAYALGNQAELHGAFPFATLYRMMQFALLAFTTVVTIRYQQRIPLDRPAAAALSGSETQPTTPVVEHQRELHLMAEGRKVIRFNWHQVVGQVLAATIVTLYVGEHSILARMTRTHQGKPNAPFWTDFSAQMVIFAAMLQFNAITYQYIRTYLLQKYASLLPTQNIQLPTSTTDEADEIRIKVKLPIAVWAFILSLQLSAVTILPYLVQELKRSSEEDKDLYRMRIICSSGTILTSVAFNLVFLFVPIRRFQLGSNNQGNSMSSVRL